MLSFARGESNSRDADRPRQPAVGLEKAPSKAEFTGIGTGKMNCSA